MIVGGQIHSETEDKTLDKAYALSLDPDVEVPSCLSSICDFPHYVQPASQAVFEDNHMPPHETHRAFGSDF